MRRLFLLAFVLAGCSSSTKPAFQSNCTVGDVPQGATTPASRPDGKSAILPGGRLVTPAGTLLAVGGYPIATKILPGDRYAVVSDDAEDDQALRIVDLKATDPLHAVVAEVPYPAGNKHTDGMLYGLAITHDGSRLYVSNGGYDPVADSQPMSAHYNTVEVYDLAGTPPVLTKNDALTIELPFSMTNSGNGQRIPTGIALSSDEKLLYVACQGDSTLSIVSLSSTTHGMEVGRVSLAGLAPFDVAVDDASKTAFVSLWGSTDATAGVIPVDVSNPMMPMALSPISTGKAAEAELLLAGRLYVTNSDDDTLSMVDAASRTVKTMPATGSMILGATPNAIAVEPAGANGAGRVYLANAGENSVVALDLDTFAVIGRVPTAWYPTAVAVLGDGTLVITSARGLGRGPSDGTPEPPFADGTIQVVPRPSDADLQAGDMTVQANLDRPHSLEAPLNCATPPAFPLQAPNAPAGTASPIQHVFLIVRENKTYDAVLGDLEGGNGDPAMLMYGENITPNAHQLARTFVLLDNFYSHAELSVQGHEWTTACIANDYTEKSWSHSDDYGRGYIPPVPWGPPSTLSSLPRPGSGSIWAHLDQAGVAYHNYGEVVNGSDAKTLADPGYPGVFFNTSISDVDKTNYVLQTILDPTFTLEPFTYLLLPNDHTMGTSPGAQTPQSMVADNDEATGRFIDGLSHSQYWLSSIVFVVEDDPGGNFDHVEEHRSIGLVASPWVKHGYKSSTNFDLGSVYHTLEMLIGVGPMNLNDGHAAAMYELFSPTPDPTPYTFVPRTYPVTTNSADAPLAAESAKIDFSRPDTADLSRIEWKATHGRDAEPPTTRRRLHDDDGDDD